jgi:hypothetical protein
MSEIRKSYGVSLKGGLRSNLVAGFSHGMAQMGSFGSVGSLADYPRPSTDSMQRDWQRVGGDLKRGFEKVRKSEKKA